MSNLVSAVVAATTFAIGTAYAQIPAKPNVNIVANDEVDAVAISATTTAKTEVTSDRQPGALDECYSSIAG